MEYWVFDISATGYYYLKETGWACRNGQNSLSILSVWFQADVLLQCKLRRFSAQSYAQPIFFKICVVVSCNTDWEV